MSKTNKHVKKNWQNFISKKERLTTKSNKDEYDLAILDDGFQDLSINKF